MVFVGQGPDYLSLRTSALASVAIPPNVLSLRTSPQTGVAIPRLEEKCIDNFPTERGNVTISGGNRYLIPFNRGIATTSLRTGLAMTGNLEPVRQTPICRHAVKSDGHVLFPKKHPGHFCPGCGGIYAFAGCFSLRCPRLVRAKADTARLMRGKTTFLYWGFPTFVGLKPQKEKAEKSLCPNQKFPTSADFS